MQTEADFEVVEVGSATAQQQQGDEACSFSSSSSSSEPDALHSFDDKDGNKGDGAVIAASTDLFQPSTGAETVIPSLSHDGPIAAPPTSTDLIYLPPPPPPLPGTAPTPPPAPAAEAVPSTATERLLRDVVAGLAQHLASFTGSSASLPRGVTIARDAAAETPAGTAEFGVYWFGAAVATARHVLEESRPLDGFESTASPAALLSLAALRQRFARQLTDAVLPEMLMTAGAGYYSYAKPHALTEAMQRLARRSMRARVRDPGTLAAGLYTASAAFGSNDDLVTDAAVAESVLLADFAYWICSFYPLFQFASRQTSEAVDFLWGDDGDTDDDTVINSGNNNNNTNNSGAVAAAPGILRLLAESLHWAASATNLQTNEAGEQRGALVPRAWLAGALRWLEAALRCEDRGLPPPPDLAVPPPMSTQDCVAVAATAATAHWLLPAGREAVEVVPEGVFHLLWLHFGGGPKYALYGHFPSRDALLRLTRPRTARIALEFDGRWPKSQQDGGASDTAKDAHTPPTTLVTVEEANVRNTLAQVLREAVGEISLEDVDDDESLRALQVAVCGSGFLEVRLKRIRDVCARYGAWPVVGDPADFTVADTIAFGKMSIREQRECWNLTNGAAPAKGDGDDAEEEEEEEEMELGLRVTFVGDSGCNPSAPQDDGNNAGTADGGAMADGPAAETEPLLPAFYTDKPAVRTLEEAMSKSGVCGLVNVGNTCFMNSALQCLSNLRPFREHLLAANPLHYGGGAAITSALQAVFCQLWSGQYTSAEMHALKGVIGQRIKRYAGYMQQDAGEFMEALLDAVGEELNRVSNRRYLERRDEDAAVPCAELAQRFWDSYLENNTSFVSQDFFVQNRTVFECSQCHTRCNVFDSSLLQTVSIPTPVAKEEFTVEAMVQVDAGGNKDGDAAVLDFSKALHLQLTVKVTVPGPDKAPAIADVRSAVSAALRKDPDLRRTVLQDLRGAGAEDDETNDETNHNQSNDDAPLVRFDDISLLRHPTATDKTYFAHAIARLGSAPPPPPPPTAAAAAPPPVRVWYFLKGNGHLTLEPLSAVIDLPVGPSPSPAADAAAAAGGATDASAAENEEVDGGEEGKGGKHGTDAAAATVAATASAECSRRILEGARRLALDMLVHERGVPLNDFALDLMNPSGQTVAAERQLDGEIQFEMLHYTHFMKGLRNIEEAVRTGGDAWITEYAQERAQSRLAAAAAAAGGEEAEEATLPLIVFVKYDSYDYAPRKWRNAKGDLVAPGAAAASSKAFSKWWGSSGVKSAGAARSDDDDADAPEISLQDCLRHAMQTDTLRGDDSWFCPTCKEMREATIQTSMFRLPPCIVISLNRFRVAGAAHARANKNNAVINFPVECDFNPYLDPEAPQRRHRPGKDASEDKEEEGGGGDDENEEEDKDGASETNYRLRGVVYHSGSLSFGHYTAAAYNDHLRRWVHYNDSSATVLSAATAAPPTRNAYVVCYERAAPPAKDKGERDTSKGGSGSVEH